MSCSYQTVKYCGVDLLIKQFDKRAKNRLQPLCHSGAVFSCGWSFNSSTGEQHSGSLLGVRTSRREQTHVDGTLWTILTGLCRKLSSTHKLFACGLTNILPHKMAVYVSICLYPLRVCPDCCHYARQSASPEITMCPS